MWKLEMRGARGTPFQQLGSFASIAEAAETVRKMERDDNGWIFFKVSVYTLNEEPTSDAEVLIDRPAVLPASNSLSPLARLADIPEEEIWLAKQKSKRTRRAYKLDVQHFMKTLHITTYEELRKVDHRAVIAWERIMREIDEAEPSTIRRRLAALSSLFKHLVRHGHAESNPVAEVERPAINRREGSTLAFSKVDAARILNAPVEDTIEGLRDRAILSVGLQVGLRARRWPRSASKTSTRTGASTACASCAKAAGATPLPSIPMSPVWYLRFFLDGIRSSLGGFGFNFHVAELI